MVLSILISSFYQVDIGPILRDEIKNAAVKNEDFILVYLKNSLGEQLKPILSKIDNVKFRCFPDNEKDFISSLISCKGVIASAGHQLISECLHLKKPALVFPEVAQYEQELNANMLVKTGWGMIGDIKMAEKSILEFSKNLNNFPFKDSDNNYNFILHDDLENAIIYINQFLKENVSEKNILQTV